LKQTVRLGLGLGGARLSAFLGSLSRTEWDPVINAVLVGFGDVEGLIIPHLDIALGTQVGREGRRRSRDIFFKR
jgi:hypothetical protein